MKKTLCLFIYTVILFTNNVLAQTSDSAPGISETDRIRLAEAFRLNKTLSEKVWKGWKSAPFAVLLVTPENEFLLRHPAPSKDFTEIGYDQLLKSRVYRRKRVFNQSFLATFSAISGSGVSTIVVGQAENTWVKTSTPWVVMMLHEHFHQLQDSQAGIFQDIAGLDLSGGDQTGMWMLNYPFPYKDKQINEDFAQMSKQLAKVLETPDANAFQDEFNTYLKMRKTFNSSLKDKDYKYLSFQLWKEGTARYIEYKIAQLAADKYKPNKSFQRLKDFKPYGEVAEDWRKKIIESLKTIRLDANGREVAYPFGAAEVMLLDRAKIDWKSRYFSEKFYQDKYFESKK